MVPAWGEMIHYPSVTRVSLAAMELQSDRLVAKPQSSTRESANPGLLL